MRVVRFKVLSLWCMIAIGAITLCQSIVYEPYDDLQGPVLQTYGAVSAEANVVRPFFGGRSRPFQKISEQGGEVSAEYGFINFNDDFLKLVVRLQQKELADYRRDYGYTRGDLDALLAWQRKAMEEAIRTAVKRGWNQAKLNEVADAIRSEYRQKSRELFAARGFRYNSASTIIPDIPGIVRRNVVPLNSLASAFAQAAESRDYDAEATIGAVLSLVQTAIRYESIPPEQDGRKTGGMNPPLLTLSEGRGDCDSKTALMASILLNWDHIRLVGVGIPNHYLLGILRNPRRGEAYIDFEGLKYVLVEPAGPGWLPPGRVAQRTMDIINTGKGVTVDLLTAR